MGGMHPDETGEAALPSPAEFRLHPATAEDLLTCGGWMRSGVEVAEWTGRWFAYPLEERALVDHVAGSDGPTSAVRCFAMRDTSTDRWSAVEMSLRRS